MAAVSPSQSDIFTALRAFLLAILPAGVVVQQGQANRVAEPGAPDFVLMTPIGRQRLETNVDTYADVAFTGSIADTVLTVSTVRLGTISVGSVVFGANIAVGTTIIALGSGTGGVGTYTVSPTQTVASEAMAAGLKYLSQPTKITIQLDVHGPSAADNAQTISTMMRDDVAVQSFAASGFDVTPLYADDPRQMPFVNGAGQYETRWIVEVALQANQINVSPMQFADTLHANVTSVQAVFPAS